MGKIESSPPSGNHALVVADAGPIIHLDELDALDVLSDYAAVQVPEAVWQEVEHHRPTALNHPAVRWVRVHAIMPSPRVAALGTLYTLHRGEQAALNLCLQTHINTLLTDDTAARMAAQNLHLVTHGTLGLLLRSIRMRTRTSAEVLELLQAIPQRSTLHIRSGLLHNIIQQLRDTGSDV